MKPLLIALMSCLTIGAFAQAGSKKASVPTSGSHTPYVYFMMKNGQLMEYDHGRLSKVTADVTLPNKTTIHPDATINLADGHVVKLNEGEYIAMDGKIRRLADMAKP
jgi:hypothetical protein